jgi:carbon monoxide dehydrogenase subunit G
MTTIESKKTRVAASAEQVFGFLADANNHEKLMPENVYNWSSDKDSVKFTIKNMAKLELQISERNPNTNIKVVTKGEAPFDVSLVWNITEAGSECDVQLTINADLNPFIKMMAVGPLQKLADFQVEKLPAVL